MIAALTADPVPEPIRLGRRIVAALAIGFLGSLAIYGLLMGPRPDIAAACMTMRALLAEVRRLVRVRIADAPPGRCSWRAQTPSRGRSRSG